MLTTPFGPVAAGLLACTVVVGGFNPPQRPGATRPETWAFQCPAIARGCRTLLPGTADSVEGGEQAERGGLQQQDRKPVNVVCTHVTADFDSLAAAVGLAKLWQHERPEEETFVCVPRGTHPVVKTFLALHKNMFPMKTLKDLDHEQVHRVGLVDAQRLDRVGPGASLLERAVEVHVYDHHVEQNTDIAATQLVIQKVGSVTTIITELLTEQGLHLRDAEATLLALGVHSDTGSLTYDSATARDAKALAWLMEQGASQQAVAEYGKTSLSQELQSTLTDVLNTLNRTVLNGATVSTAFVELEMFINGMARVAQNVLDVTDSDVFLLGATFPHRKGKEVKNMIVVGRARPRMSSVNLDQLLSEYGGGGHPKAAAVSMRLDDPTLPGGGSDSPRQILQRLVDRVLGEQIKAEARAEDIMTAPVLTCHPDDTIDKIASTLDFKCIRGMPVVLEDDKVVGMISIKEVEKAQRAGKGASAAKGWMGTQVLSASVGQPRHEVEALLVQNDAGRVPVLQDGKLVGLITRADLLREHSYYDSVHYHNKAYADPVDSPMRRMLMDLRRKLKRFDDD